jgi:excisionase family DNA binding protein
MNNETEIKKIDSTQDVVNRNDILTPAELAAEWKTTKPTVLSWFHKGIIPAAVSNGRVIRFDRKLVAQALATGSANRRANA